MRPYYLDGDRTKWFGDTQLCGRAYARPLWLLCSFQGPPEANARRVGEGSSRKRKTPPGGRRSLKAQQHAGHPTPRSRKNAAPGAKAGQVRSTC
jgi:hypothetical protein